MVFLGFCLADRSCPKKTNRLYSLTKRRRKFERNSGVSRYRRIFIISVEGTKTEPQYFSIFNDRSKVIHTTCIYDRKTSSSPLQALERIRSHLEAKKLRKGDEAWIVVDKYNWRDQDLAQLFKWSLKSDSYGFALSNPKFEYWLLLHFEDGHGVRTPKECDDRLVRQLPDYCKNINPRLFSEARILEAISRAERKDSPLIIDWHRSECGTTVHRLVKKLIDC